MTTGGVEWELDSAWQQIKVARQNGDIDAEGLGWLRYSEGLRNLAVSALSSQLIPMLEELRGMRSERSADAKIAAHKLDLLMTLAESSQAHWGQIEARLGLVETSTLSTVISQVEREQLFDLVRTIPHLTARIAALEASHHAE